MTDSNDPKKKITQLFEQTNSKKGGSAPHDNSRHVTQTGSGNIYAEGDVHFNQPATKPRVQVSADPGGEHVSDEQKAKLKQLVDDVIATEQKLKKRPRSYGAVWGALNKHCKVTTYHRIAFEDFEKARRFLHQELGRLNSMKSAPVKNGDDWRNRKYKYIKINSKDPADKKAIDAYILKNFGATSLTELANDELERAYRYIAGRRNKR
ncbi:MAG: hypothetical protein ACRBB0_25455 [Pelagimonas sp.]|uniref:hypothetical protein n=1 Tax=Pelagimonas sp. TaxID=2073170 RepID=UPI003D6BB0D1